MKKSLSLKKLLMITTLSTLLVACGDDNKTAADSSDGLDTRFVTIATGGSSGPYNIIGTTLGQIYSDRKSVV